MEFCVKYDINYEEERVEATLEITDQIPSVRVGDEKYYLKALKAGTPLDVIEAVRTHFDERLSRGKLRLLMGKSNAFTSQPNIKQAFRSNELGEGNVLCPFAEISSDTFMLKERANLTVKELAAIQKASTN